MPVARRQLVDVTVTPYYHVISRCVRRAHLCGRDFHTGKNFDHRKEWLVERIRTLAGIFAVKVFAYAVMSNHYHLVIALEPARAREWSDHEVVARWGQLFKRSSDRLLQIPVNMRQRFVDRWRERLADLSWFMRCLNESIARRANREDGCTGRFWEGRFKSQALLDEGAVVTCMCYVDLNEVRAGIVGKLRDSRFSSIGERLRNRPQSTWLAKFQSEAGHLSAIGPSDTKRELLGVIPVDFTNYLELLRATAHALKVSKAERLSGAAANTVESVGLDPGAFVQAVRTYSLRFFGMVGHVDRLRVACARWGRKRSRGAAAARLLYRRAA
ncbi:MAG: transposase [Candidatus Binatia bacterium]|nr:transposase [Candidatus Binatia bacterium]